MEKAQQQATSKRIVTGIALGAIFLYSLTNSLMSTLINEVVEGFSLSGASQGLMSSMFGLGSMLALFATPLMQGRISKLVILFGAGLLQVVSLALCGASPVFPLFCASCSLLGVGGGLVDAYTNSLLVDVHKGESHRYLGYLHGLFGVGSLLMPMVALQLLGWMSWRGVFYVMAGVLLVGISLLIGLSLRVRGSEAEQATQEKVLGLSDVKEYLKTPRNAAVLAAAIFAVSSQTGALMWIVRYMTLRFDAEALGVASLSAYWICATLNRFSVTRLRVRPLRIFTVGAALAAVCLGLGVLSGSAWGMCVAMGGFGLLTGHFMQVLFGEAAMGYEGRTTFPTAVLSVVLGIARSAMPLVMAAVSASLSAEISMLIPAVACLGAVLAGLLMEKYKVGRKDLEFDGSKNHPL